MSNVALTEKDFIYSVTWYDRVEGRVMRREFRSREEAERFALERGGEVRPVMLRSGWRKLFAIHEGSLANESVRVSFQQVGDFIIEHESACGFNQRTVYRADDFSPVRSVATVVVSLRGRLMVGVGGCEVTEFMRRDETGQWVVDRFRATAHNIKALAFTRALSRAISDGTGEGFVTIDEIRALTEDERGLDENGVDGEGAIGEVGGVDNGVVVVTAQPEAEKEPDEEEVSGGEPEGSPVMQQPVKKDSSDQLKQTILNLAEGIVRLAIGKTREQAVRSGQGKQFDRTVEQTILEAYQRVTKSSLPDLEAFKTQVKSVEVLQEMKQVLSSAYRKLRERKLQKEPVTASEEPEPENPTDDISEYDDFPF